MPAESQHFCFSRDDHIPVLAESQGRQDGPITQSCLEVRMQQAIQHTCCQGISSTQAVDYLGWLGRLVLPAISIPAQESPFHRMSQ